MTEKGYYDLTGLKQIADCLGVCARTVRKYVHIYDLPIIRICGTFKASTHELDDWLKKRKQSY